MHIAGRHTALDIFSFTVFFINKTGRNISIKAIFRKSLIDFESNYNQDANFLQKNNRIV